MEETLRQVMDGNVLIRLKTQLYISTLGNSIAIIFKKITIVKSS